MHLRYCLLYSLYNIINLIMSTSRIIPGTNVTNWTPVHGISVEAHHTNAEPKIKSAFKTLGIYIDSIQIFMTDDTFMELSRNAMTILRTQIAAQIKQRTNRTTDCANSDRINQLVNNHLPLTYRKNNCTLALQEIKALGNMFDSTVQAQQGITVIYIGFHSVHFNRTLDYFDITN